MSMIDLDSSEANGALSVCRVIARRGGQAWLVGGAVRDALLGEPAHDWDIATSITPDQILRWFPRVIPTGIKHGTVTVLDDNGHKYEVTTFRGDGVYSDGRRPDSVAFSENIEHDLARRDLTVNAVAYDPINDRFCDPHGGAADLLLGRLRCVGDPLKRFAEDGLRCLRACRFAATLGFEIDPPTFAAIGQRLETYSRVSVERIVDEWRKALKAERPSIAFDLMMRSGLLSVTVPEFVDSVGCQQNDYHEHDVWTHVLAVLDAAPHEELVQLGALFHDISKPPCRDVHPKTGQFTFYNHEERGADLTREVMTRLKFSTAEVDTVSHMVQHHLLPHERLTSAGLRRWVQRVGAESVDGILKLAQADLVGKGNAKKVIPADFVSRFRERIQFLETKAPIVSKTGQLAINGKDIMTICGLKPGPEIGFLLVKCLEFVTDDPDRNTREALTSFLQTETMVT